MYSASQSILPVDPRDRLYYRPRRHLIQCYVDRKKNHKKNLVKTLSPGKNCIYSFHLEFTNEFVIACEPRPVLGRRTVADNSDGINGQQYTVEQGPGTTLFSINPADLEDPNAFVGKMSRRSKGLELVMFSEGNNATRKELAAIMMLPSEDGQRRFRVILPTIDPDTGFIRPVEGGEVKFLRDGRGTSIVGGSRAGLAEAMLEFSGDDDDNPGSMTRSQAPTFAALTEPQAEVHGTAKKLTMHCQLVREFLTNGEKSPNIIVLENRKPQWDSVLRGYQLNFHGRATEASEKNFQLVSPKDPEKVVMLFGKQKSDRYSVDFRYPLCGLQAAAIASALMEYKMITK
ncbi:tub family protein-like protein [Angomonas deanei]|nr:tub family protein-like protein [Angomonas deanei]|eukprot:EPY41079.1 tub family protein-like protein [Angomonas deanei]